MYRSMPVSKKVGTYLPTYSVINCLKTISWGIKLLEDFHFTLLFTLKSIQITYVTLEYKAFKDSFINIIQVQPFRWYYKILYIILKR